MGNQVVADLTNQITDLSIPSGANLTQPKLQHRHQVAYQQIGGADATAADAILYRAYKSATVLEAKITPDAVPAGGTKTLTVDIQNSTGGGAWATNLTGTTSLGTSDTARTPKAISLSGTPTMVAGDVLRAHLTIGGSGGTGVQGFIVDVVIAENGT